MSKFDEVNEVIAQINSSWGAVDENNIRKATKAHRMSMSLAGRKLSDEHIAVLAQPKSDAHKLSLSLARMGKRASKEAVANLNKGREIANTPEVRAKAAKSNTGKTRSEDCRSKMKTAWETRKENIPIVTCPHCSYTAKAFATVYRYHFDRCKLNPENIANQK